MSNEKLIIYLEMNYLIMVREVSGQVASLPLPSKAKEVMVKSSCKHCMAVHSKLALKLTKKV